MNGVPGLTPLHVVLHTVAHFMNSRSGRDDAIDTTTSKLENSSYSKLRNTGVKSWIRTINLLLNSGDLSEQFHSSHLILPPSRCPMEPFAPISSRRN
jgi:hypothetical protein